MAVQYCNGRDGSTLFRKLAQIMKYDITAMRTQQEWQDSKTNKQFETNKSDKIDALSDF